MAKLCKRKLGQCLACGVVLTFYLMIMTKIGISSIVFVQDVPHSTSITPERNISLSLAETASYLYRQHLSQQMKFIFVQEPGTPRDQHISAAGRLPRFCQDKGFDKKPITKYPRSTIIISLVDVTSEEALILLSRILRHTSEDLVDDVIVTADIGMETKHKDVLEQALDVCSICRLFFMAGTIYQHRNSVARFARSSILIFVDARIEPSSDYWLEPLIFEVTFNHYSVVSPDLRLRRRNSGTIISEGLTRIGMTWDMEAVRIPVTPEQNRMLQQEKTMSINQTSILKEVFAIRKQFFLDLGSFDVIQSSSSSPSSSQSSHSSSGGEHVSFSLKVINCGGEILTSFCSRVILDTPEMIKSSANQRRQIIYPRDYGSLSFRVNQQNLTSYYASNSDVWLDAYSSNLFAASVHRQPVDPFREGPVIPMTTPLPPRNYRRYVHRDHGRTASHSRALKSKMKSMECETTNYRYILTKYQEDMVMIDRKTQKHGFIRSLDGVYALGINTQTSMPSEILKTDNLKSIKRSLSSNGIDRQGWPVLVLTRNSSQWVGPFSYQQGMIQYNRMWCIAVTVTVTARTGNNDDDDDNDDDKNNDKYSVVLQPCKMSTTSQMFIFKDNVLRWGGNGAKWCVSAAAIGEDGEKENENSAKVSRDLVLTRCVDMETKLNDKNRGHYFDLLKIDTEFIESNRE